MMLLETRSWMTVSISGVGRVCWNIRGPVKGAGKFTPLVMSSVSHGSFVALKKMV
jgi:hypothetical protein